jgi:hypothetical protein
MGVSRVGAELLKDIDGADVLVAGGLIALAAGLCGYDWRLAAVVVGVLVLALGMLSVVRRGA